MWLPPAWLFPVTESASLTLRVIGGGLLVGVAALGLGSFAGWRRVRRLGWSLLLLFGVGWIALALSSPPWQRVALADGHSLRLDAAPFVAVLAGVEVSRYHLLEAATEVEAIDLVRLDPALHRFSVLTDAEHPLPIEAWRERLGAVAVVNGSYFLPDHTPQTPLRSGGEALGPLRYTSTHAAFVSDPASGAVAIVDLAGVELPRGLSPFPEAMVSYPLLLANDGASRAEGSHDWLASRTFVGIDRRGWVVLGTSHHGYFSLRRLAAFLREAPLELTTALNLDGGPIAAQAVQAGGFSRVTVGDAETNAGDDLLRARLQALRHLHVPLPIVLAAHARPAPAEADAW